jgi:SAM-dependent methyltransferase
VVSNLGVNNFADPARCLAECRRVLRPGGVMALTSNLVGHMRELYDGFERGLAHDAAALARLRAHVAHRATVESLHAMLSDAGFTITATHRSEAVMRFASVRALAEHHFIRLGFRPAWEEVAGSAETFARMLAAADTGGELRLTIPLAYAAGRR